MLDIIILLAIIAFFVDLGWKFLLKKYNKYSRLLISSVSTSLLYSAVFFFVKPSISSEDLLSWLAFTGVILTVTFIVLVFIEKCKLAKILWKRKLEFLTFVSVFLNLRRWYDFYVSPPFVNHVSYYSFSTQITPFIFRTILFTTSLMSVLYIVLYFRKSKFISSLMGYALLISIIVSTFMTHVLYAHVSWAP